MLGQPITQVRSNSSLYNVQVSPNSTCEYGGTTGGVLLVIAQSSAAPGSAAWKQEQSDFARVVGAKATITQLSGLGEWAEWFDNGKDAGGFAVAKYTYLISVIIGGRINAPSAYQPELRQLVLMVLSRLAL